MPARTACSSGPVPGSSLRDANDAAPQTGASLTGVDVAAVDLGAAILAAVTVALLIGTAWHRCCLNRYRQRTTRGRHDRARQPDDRQLGWESRHRLDFVSKPRASPPVLPPAHANLPGMHRQFPRVMGW
jgi:hypothetical protein